jgi:integrase/recombinase XerD
MKTYVEPDEVTLMESATNNLRDRLLVRLLFCLGCRVSEALSLKVEDVDFTRGTVTILHLKRRLKLSCANCGATLGMSHSFCPRCGVKLNEAT